MKAEEIVKKYASNKEHLKNTSKLALLLFEKIRPFFLRLENYNNPKDLTLLKLGALLHDIGINFEEGYGLSHNKAGAAFILENKPDEINEEELFVLACLIRYHRKSFPNEKYPPYKALCQKDKAKVNFLGAIIRLADGLDTRHIGLIENFEAGYDKKLNVLTLFLPGNIMLNDSFLKATERKKDFFEEAYKVKLKFGSL